MSSRNRNSTLHKRPRLVGALPPIYIRQDEGKGHFLNNVPRKRRSGSSLDTKRKPTSSTNEDGSKEIPTVTKILIGTCFAAIFTPQVSEVTTNSTSAKLEIIFQWVAILSMIVGMYVEGKRPKLSKWLQRFGHLNCLVGLMLMQGSLLQLPVNYAWIPPVGIALILGAAMVFQT